jgi:hypothetical protein
MMFELCESRNNSCDNPLVVPRPDSRRVRRLYLTGESIGLSQGKPNTLLEIFVGCEEIPDLSSWISQGYG